MSVATYTKDPSAKANFSIDYIDWLAERGAGITIIASTWTVPAGITQAAASFSTTKTTIQLSGGSDGLDYEVVNHITLSDTQEDEKSLLIRVRQVEATDRANALTLLLGLLAQPSAAPTLSADEVELILDHCLYATTWSANKAYNMGDRVVPVNRNGHYYEVVQPGTSQSTARSYSDWPVATGRSLSDGSSDPMLIWEEAGDDLFNPDFAGYERNLYDIGRAAGACWLLKARKANQAIDEGDVSFSQWRDNCLKEAERFHPIRRSILVVRC